VEFAMGGGRKVRMRVTVELRRNRRDQAYSLVNNAHIVATDDQAGHLWRTYRVRRGLWIEVLVKNLGGEAVDLRHSWFDDAVTHVPAVVVTIEPQKEYTLPVPLRMEAHERKNGWNLYLERESVARLVLVFERDADGEETIRELLFAMKKVVDAYG
jgi:hypothetical protein